LKISVLFTGMEKIIKMLYNVMIFENTK